MCNEQRWCVAFVRERCEKKKTMRDEKRNENLGFRVEESQKLFSVE